MVSLSIPRFRYQVGPKAPFAKFAGIFSGSMKAGGSSWKPSPLRVLAATCGAPVTTGPTLLAYRLASVVSVYNGSEARRCLYEARMAKISFPANRC